MQEKTSNIPVYKRPAVYITGAILVGLIAAFATSGNKKAPAAETPLLMKLSDPPSYTDPTPTPQLKQEQNATATQESKAIRTGDITGNNTTIINGNQYNIIINPTPEPQYETIPPPTPKLPTVVTPIKKPEPVVKNKQPCEVEMQKHNATVAKWQLLFKK